MNFVGAVSTATIEIAATKTRSPPARAVLCEDIFDQLKPAKAGFVNFVGAVLTATIEIAAGFVNLVGAVSTATLFLRRLA